MTDFKKNKKSKSLVSPSQLLELGKLPPQAVDLEEAVLGAIMLDGAALADVIDILNKPEVFYKEAHQRIFSAIKSLFERAEPVDILTVTQELKKSGELEMAGGAFYVTQLTNRVASASNVEMHSRIVIEKYLQREIIRINTDGLQRAFEDTTDIFDLLDKSEQDLFELSNIFIKKNFESARVVAGKTMTEIEAMRLQSGTTGVPSGFKKLDDITGGWQKGELILLAARTSIGKCLGKSTKVIMFDGSMKNVEDIQVGDLLMGNDSTPRKVLSTTSGIDKMYWIHQNHGISYRVNSEHILSLRRSDNGYYYRNGKRYKCKGNHGDITNISVKDFLKCSERFKRLRKGYKAAIDFAYKELPLDPYFLGAWLGDGCSGNVRITNIDEGIINFLKNFAEMSGMKCHKYRMMYGITKKNGSSDKPSIQKLMRKMGLLNNKHIPHYYLCNSRENRLQLLAGLIDTDGCRCGDTSGDGTGGYEIIQKNERLIKEIKFLCDSLGLRTTLSKKICRIKSRNFEGVYHRLIIFGEVEKIPVKIERKKLKNAKHRCSWQNTGIKVEFDKVDEYYGFELDGNGLFLLEDCTVTHNSALAMQFARNAVIDFQKPVAVFSLEMTSISLMMRLFATESEIPAEKIRRGLLDDAEFNLLNSKIGPLVSSKLFIDDTPHISLFEFRSKARRLKAQHDIQMIVIDYLQLMTVADGAGRNREQEVSMVSRTLKGIAKELNIPIIALSQLSREADKRVEKKGRPQLSDLRESGSQEQDSDLVLFIYRPEKLGYLTDDDGNSTAGVAEIIVAKHRNGRTGSEAFYFNEQFARFEDNSSSSFSITSISPSLPSSSSAADFLDSKPEIKSTQPSTENINFENPESPESDQWYNRD